MATHHHNENNNHSHHHDDHHSDRHHNHHGHHHEHHYGHHRGYHRGHHHAPTNYNRAFIVSVTLNIIFVAIEAGYGLLSNSLALLADAGHNLSDVLGLLLAWGASVLVKRQPTDRRTFGLRRSSIFAALINAIVLLLASGGIAWEAVHRIWNPEPVAGGTMILVAAIGIAINAGSAVMFLSGRDRDLNIRGAFLHLVSDAAVSAGVVLAGFVISATAWNWVDPAIGLLITAVIALGTWGVLREAFDLALDAVPDQIEPKAVRIYLEERSGVAEVHDLHIWAMSTTETALTVHLVMPQGHPGDEFLADISQGLQSHFNIGHATIQIELGNSEHPCALASDGVV